MTSVEDILEHHGIKGMKWGIRNDRQATGYRLQGSHLEIDSSINRSTQTVVKDVASMMNHRYGFQITGVKDLKVAEPAEYASGTIGFVKFTPGQKGGVIYVRPDDVRPGLKASEDQKWLAEGTGNTRAFLTHESAHAMFHAEQQVKIGILKPRIVGGNADAREEALKVAMKRAKKDGTPRRAFLSKISGYALASGTRQEAEAELFSQYHWNPNPPPFVKVWGETLHREMGIDGTPFREVVNHD